VRHGERADLAPLSKTSKPYLIKHDPPLTDKGIQQAIETGQALKKFLKTDM
jgi:broad specificity phosphatase PhoE